MPVALLFKKNPFYLQEWALLIGGALMPFSFAPYGLYWLQFPLLALLFLSCLQQAPGIAMRRGFLFSLGFFVHGIHWIFYSLHYHGAAPLALAVIIVVLLAAYLSLFPAFALYLSNRLFSRAGAPLLLLIYAISWMLFEWLRGYFLTGFPWLQLGTAHVDSWLAGFAPLFGGLGVGFLVALLAAALALSLLKKQPLYVLACAGVIYLGGFLLGQVSWTQAVGEPLKVSLLQGNIPQSQKWRREMYAPTLQMYRQLTRQHLQSDLIIWPETAIPGFADRVEDYLSGLAAEAERSNTEVLLGVFVRDAQSERYYNSLVDLNGQVYRKRHLVPLGEYFPLRPLLGFFAQWIDIPMSDIDSGEDDQPLIKVAGQPVGVSICFEDAFDRDVLQDLPEATLLVNVSNDAWFEDSPQPWQHHQIAQMRALESGRSLLRVTNTGVTSFIGADGRVQAMATQFKREVLTHEVQAYSGATPYVRWQNYLLIGAGLILLLVLYRRYARNKDQQ